MIEPSAMFPVFVAENLTTLRDYYLDYFGFQAVFFDADFYLHLLHPDSGIQIGFLVPNHPSQPEFLFPVAAKEGMVISFEVDNARSAFAEAKQLGLDIAMTLKEETWGQTHFMVRDPAGFVIDIVQHVDQQ